MTKKPQHRYDMRRNENGLWAVYDILTGEPVIVNDVVIDALDIEEADDMVDLLNRLYLEGKEAGSH